MFDFGLSSVNRGMELLGGGLDFDDLAFLGLVECLGEIDGSLSAKLEEIRRLNRQKAALAEQIGALNEALERSHTKVDDPDGLVYVEGGLENPRDPSAGAFPTAEEQQAYEKAVEDYRRGHPGLPVPMTIDTHANQNGLDRMGRDLQKLQELADPSGFAPSDLAGATCYRRGDVQNRIDELQRELEGLNTNSQVALVDLQRLMNKRAEAVQLTTNLMARSHETAMGVIANLK
jgi:hypothetical protein